MNQRHHVVLKIAAAVLIASAMSSSAYAQNVLVFTTPPSNTSAGSVMTSVKVTVQDGLGGTVTTANNSITLAIGTNPGSGVLSGTVTVSAVNGVATFANLSIDKAGTGYTLTAATSGLTTITSATFNISAATANKMAFIVQPTNTLSNVGISPDVKVAIQDNFGNTVLSATDTITLSLGANPNGAVLSGTASKAAVNGVATFTGLKLDNAGADYTLIAASTNFSNVESDPFDITYQLQISVQPTNAQAGVNIAPAIQVQIKDGNGVIVPTNSLQVVMTIGTNPTNATLSGTATVQAQNGVATFSGLNITKAGTGYTLVASATDSSSATSTPFNITPGAANKLAFTVQPSTAVVTTTITPAVVVAIKDLHDNDVPTATNAITLSIRGNPSMGTLSGTTTVNAVGGSATFNNLSINNAGNGYTLAANSGGLTEKVSNSFNITYKLVFLQQPTSSQAGVAIAPAITVAIQDNAGNTITTAGNNVTLSILNNPSSGSITGTATIAAQSGIATFSNIVINKVGTGYTLKATGTSLAQGASGAFNITPGPPAKLTFSSQPGSSTIAGAVMPSFLIAVRDQFDNIVPDATNVVTLSLSTNPGGGSITGGSTAASAGIATFANVSINLPAIGYRFTASSPGLTDAVSSLFNIKYLLAFIQQPVDIGCTEQIFTKVAIQNAQNVTLTSINDELITLSCSSNNVILTLDGETPVQVPCVNGVADFAGVEINKAGTFTLKGSGDNQSGTCTSESFVVDGCNFALKFLTQPSSTLVNLPFSQSVRVGVVDLNGTVVTSATGSVSLMFLVNPTNALFTPNSSVVSAPLVNGIATFTNLAVDRAGQDFTLLAFSASYIDAISNKFTIRYKLGFTTQPTLTVAGSPINAGTGVVVSVFDGLDVPQPDAVGNITVSLGANPGSGTLSGTKVVSVVNGAATYTTLSINKSGVGYKLNASGGTLFVSTTSTAFTIVAGPANKLAFTTQPSSTALVNGSLSPAVKVAVQDALGNTVTSSTFSIALTLDDNPTGATLGGSTTLNTVSGVATFANISLNKAGASYNLAATCVGLANPTVVSSNFTVKYAVVFTVQPGTTIAGEVITPGIQIALQDAFGSTVTNAANNIVLGFNSNPSSGTLSGETTVAAVNGIAVFSDININRSGVGYKLSATVASSLGTVASAAFDINPGTAAKLAFTTQPSSTVSGVGIAPAVRVAVQDSQGNQVSTASDEITIEISTNPAGGTLTGTSVLPAANGLAQFSTLKIDKSGTGYKLTASAPGLTSAISNSFNITVAGPSKLGFTVEPVNSVVSATMANVKVAVQDAFGNTITSLSPTNVTLSIQTNPGGGTLGGTLTKLANNTSAGVATFDNLSINAAGNGYILKATATGLTDATSASFNMTYLLAFNTVPSSSVAGAGFSFTVTVKDGIDNTINVPGSVSIALGANPGSGTLSGTLTQTLSNGMAAFTGVSIDKAATGYTLVSSGINFISATSSTFNITFAAAAKLAFTVQPVQTLANSNVPAVKVAVQDTFGNTVTNISTGTVNMAIGTNPATGMIGGTTSATFASGVATFNSLRIDKAGIGYTFVASSASLTSATSEPFNIRYKLTFTTQPASPTVAGVTMANVRVAVQDGPGATITTATDAITLAITTNPGGGTLLGTTTVNAVSGVATFTDLSIQKSGNGYRLTATATDRDPRDSNSFNITAAGEAKLAFNAQPTNAIAAAVIAPAVTVRILDAFDNLVSSASSVTLALTTPAGATLSGTLTKNAVAGTATFNDLAVDLAGTGYTLDATSGALTPATSNAFNISYKLAFTVQPTNTASGISISPGVEVSIQNAANVTITGATNMISIALGNNIPNATLNGTTSVAAVAGKATFSNLSVSKLGTGYTLVASASGIDSATSFPFDYANKLVFTATVANAITNGVLTAAGGLKVSVQDGLGNVVNTATSSITVSIGTNAGGGLLNGTATVNAVGGVATFTNLSIDNAGAGYTLQATCPGLLGGTSSSFNVSNKLRFSVQPSNTAADSPITPGVQVSIVDAADATLTTAIDPITIALDNNPTSSALSGALTVSAENGVAVFGDLMVQKVGTGYTLIASAANASSNSSSGFNVTPGAAHHFSFSAQPVQTVAGVALAPVTVEALDLFNNRVTDTVVSVTMNLGANPGSDTLGGTLSVDTSAGLATFNDLMLTKAATGYTLSAGAPGATAGISNTFNIVPAAATQLLVSQQPGNTVAGVSITPAPAARIADQFGNTVSSSASVTVALGDNPAGGVLLGTSTLNAVAGVATFSNLSIQKAGAGYSLAFTSGALTAAESNSFEILPASATKVVFTSQPVSGVAAAILSPDVIVAVQDAFGNVVTSNSGDVTVALGNPNGSVLFGNTTVIAVNGVATFSDLSVDKAGLNYTLLASSAGLTGATSDTFNMLNRLAFKVAPPSSTLAGQTMSPAVEVSIVNANGLVITTATNSITLALDNPPAGATLLGTTTASAVSGVATFSNLNMQKAGTGFRMKATGTNLSEGVSSTFSITPGAATHIGFVSPPGNTAAGAPLGVVVGGLDQFENVATSANLTIGIALTTNPGSTTLNGSPFSRQTSSGVADFSDLNLTKVANGYVLTASASGFSNVASSPFNIEPAAPAKLAFQNQPTNAVAGQAIAPAMTVQVFDAFDNFVPTAINTVTLSIDNNAGNGTLSGTTSVAAVAGIATFNSVSINKSGTGYTLSAGSGALQAGSSSAFNIVAGPADHIGFVIQPGTTAAGSAITPAVTVGILDTFDNVVTSGSGSATISLGANPGNSSLQGTLTKTITSGVATFADLQIDKAATGYTLIAAVNGFSNATSSAFQITHGAPASLVFIVQPSTTALGSVIAPAVQVSVLDGKGNLATTGSTAVAMSLGTNPSDAALSGTLTVNSAAGIALFADLQVSKLGSGYTLTAGATGVASATSAAFVINDQSKPVITSPVTPSAPNPQPGEGVTFTLAATDAQAVTYTWEFGDGSSQSTDAPTIAHTYTAPGNYTVLVTVTDASGQSSTSSFQIKVGSGTAPGDFCAGLNPVTMQVSQLAAKLTFAAPLKDSITLKATIQLNDNFNPVGQEIQWSISGVTASTTLDSKGKTPLSKTTKVSIKFKKPAKGQPFTARPATIQIAMKGLTLSDFYLNGIATLNKDTAKTGDTASGHACIILTGHQAYERANINGIYKAKVSKGGSFKGAGL